MGINVKNIRKVGELLLYYRNEVCKLPIEDVISILEKKYNIKLSNMSIRRTEWGERPIPILELIALSRIYKIDMTDILRIGELELFDKMIAD